jgi:hypothetical protein
MPVHPHGVNFSDVDIERIVAVLSPWAKNGRVEALGYMLREWGCIDLPDHLSLASLPSEWKQSNKALMKVENHAKKLQGAIQELDEYSRSRMRLALASSDPHNFFNIGRDEKAKVQRQIDEGLNFLNAISRLASNSKRGRPLNITAYLVILDAAALFEWFTGRKATRVVDRETGEETGAFWQFLEALWPPIFRQGTYGLQAAMKSWYAARKYQEKSPLIANIRLRLGDGRIRGQ